MAKERITPRLAPAPKLQPRATPIDTFHRADVPLRNEGPSEMLQLTQALGQFQPTLQNLAVNAQNRENTKQRSAGEQEILAQKHLQTRKALGEAVRSGKIPAASNPAFLEGMRRQVYRIEAEQYDQALRKAYAESNSRNEDDITSFMSGFTSKYIEGLGGDPTDPELAKIFTPAMEASQSNLLNRHRAERDRVVELQAEENTDREIGLTLERMRGDSGFILGATSTKQAYASKIHGIVQMHYENGMSGTRANEIMAQAIARKAIEENDTEYLELLDMIPTGTGTLGQIGRVKDIRRATEQSIWGNLEGPEGREGSDDEQPPLGGVQRDPHQPHG
jgi:hypothetical protein